MILIGMLDCPFVRRVAVSLRHLEVPFQHRNWSVVRDFELIRQFNPLGRVPALVQPDGEPLIDSTAILDFLDGRVGPERALLPPAGDERRRALRIISLALGAANKSMLLIDETFYRPEEKRYSPRTERYRNQIHGALAEIDRLAQMQIGEWMVGRRMTQADITLTCVFTFLCDALELDQSWVLYPGLSALSARCEALPEFGELRAKFTPFHASHPSERDRAAR
jgi:glutathione S-transferase